MSLGGEDEDNEGEEEEGGGGGQLKDDGWIDLVLLHIFCFCLKLSSSENLKRKETR